MATNSNNGATPDEGEIEITNTLFFDLSEIPAQTSMIFGNGFMILGVEKTTLRS